MLGSSCGVTIRASVRPSLFVLIFLEFATNTIKLYGLQGQLRIYTDSEIDRRLSLPHLGAGMGASRNGVTAVASAGEELML